jgi:hypothetical protein
VQGGTLAAAVVGARLFSVVILNAVKNPRISLLSVPHRYFLKLN